MVAVGDCGLDYKRYGSKEKQIELFLPHFDLAQKLGLPMYFHSRGTNGEFAKIIRAN